MENLDIGRQPPRHFADGAPAPAWTPEKLFALFPNLAEMPDRPGDRMSGGEQQMLTVARTLMGNPLLVLLDEPSEGVAPLIVEQMANTIVELKKEGLSHSAVRTEHPFRPAGVGPSLCAGEGPDSKTYGAKHATQASATIWLGARRRQRMQRRAVLRRTRQCDRQTERGEHLPGGDNRAEEVVEDQLRIDDITQIHRGKRHRQAVDCNKPGPLKFRIRSTGARIGTSDLAAATVGPKTNASRSQAAK